MFLTPDKSLPEPFPDGCVLLIDKPLNWTSFDVVNKIRYPLSKKLGVKRVKIGHAGTLDPLATGLLVICIGKFTKKIDEFQAESKIYTGTIRLGETTPSYDLETEINEKFPVNHINDEILEVARAQFVGDILQKPPVFSAIKIDGKRAYEFARKGLELEPAARPISIFRFEITKKNMPDLEFLVECGKGTYLRSLAHDFGKAVGSGGHLTALRRTNSGDFSVENAWKVPDLVAAILKMA